MAHLRERYLLKRLQETLRWSPSVCVVGMRQTGKTTLMKQVAQTYFTLDDDQVLSQFARSNWISLEKAAAPVSIDECQKLPKLFDRIKLYIDDRKQMGRFILSGSVRFLSKRQIRESLTGRTIILEMLPFLISEAHERPLRSDFLGVFASAGDAWFRALAKQCWLTEPHLADHLERGGLPWIGFRRDSKVRFQLQQVHLDTLLGRDLQFLIQTRLTPEKLRNLYRELCLIQGLPVNESDLARKTGMTPPTVKKMIDVFSGLFLLRRHGKTIYCEDGGLAEYAMGGPLLSRQQRLKAFVFRELLGKIHYSYAGTVTLKEYRTRGGAEVPFVWSSQGGETLAITVDAESDPGEKSIRSLESFLDGKHSGPVKAIAFHTGKDRFIARNGIFCLPISDLV